MTTKHYPALDGLRAYAALAVLLYHTTIACFWLGWVGVHFFFVLSGFLITSILLNSKEATNYFRVFYVRRFLRIFPIYYLLLFLVIIVAIVGKKNISSAGYYLFYIQNFKLAINNWNISTFPKWLNHTWTLAIEEQFYIFFPLLVRYLKERALMIACFILILLSTATRYYLSVRLPGNTINWGNTVSNLDFLSAGALLAIGIKHASINKMKLYLWAAFIVFCISFCLFTHEPFSKPIYLTNLHGQFFLTGLLIFATVTILTLVAQNNSILKVIFENRYMVYIGKISYGLYLFHYPFFLLVDHISHNNGYGNIYLIAFVKLSGSLVLAGVSYRFFESRILAVKQKFSYKFAKQP